jgi:hypothetical protein
MRIEMTDTYGGEANYSWVKRAEIKDLPENYTRRQLLKAVREALELGSGVRLKKTLDYGDTLRYDIVGACVCIFISWE